MLLYILNFVLLSLTLNAKRKALDDSTLAGSENVVDWSDDDGGLAADWDTAVFDDMDFNDDDMDFSDDMDFNDDDMDFSNDGMDFNDDMDFSDDDMDYYNDDDGFDENDLAFDDSFGYDNNDDIYGDFAEVGKERQMTGENDAGAVVNDYDDEEDEDFEDVDDNYNEDVDVEMDDDDDDDYDSNSDISGNEVDDEHNDGIEVKATKSLSTIALDEGMEDDINVFDDETNIYFDFDNNDDYDAAVIDIAEEVDIDIDVGDEETITGDSAKEEVDDADVAKEVSNKIWSTDIMHSNIMIGIVMVSLALLIVNLLIWMRYQCKSVKRSSFSKVPTVFSDSDEVNELL